MVTRRGFIEISLLDGNANPRDMFQVDFPNDQIHEMFSLHVKNRSDHQTNFIGFVEKGFGL